MKNKKIITLVATIGLITCLYGKVEAAKFYDTLGTRYEGAVERLGELKIINGVSDKTFEPNRTVTRAEFAKLIVEATLTPEEYKWATEEEKNYDFKDVEKGKWYHEYVLAATNYGYMNGYEDGTFRPDKEITYEEISKILLKALGHGYLSESDPRGWAAEYIDKMLELNIADNTSKFTTKQNATRGNVAIMLWNTLMSDVWEKIYLNDVAGFTFVNSERLLIDKKIKGFTYNKGCEIKGFKEIDDKLCVELNGYYYTLYDQDTPVMFSMIGGTSDVLYKHIRYPQSIYRYEVVGLTTDISSQLYSGTFEQLKDDGFSIAKNIKRIGPNVDFGYYIKTENEKEEDRVLAVGSGNRRFYITKVAIAKESKEIEKDDDEIIKEIKSRKNDYEYIEKAQTITKKITLNEEYEIQDGAVLFKNNKRVKWDSLKEGDIVTEIKKDEYYFVTNDVVDVTIEKYNVTSEGVEFTTSNGKYKSYRNTEFLDYFADNSKISNIARLKEDELKELINLEVRLYLDFAGNIARMELLQSNVKEEEAFQELGIGFFEIMDYSKDNKTYITIVFDGKRKTYRSSLTACDVIPGELVRFTLDENNMIKEIKAITGNYEINKKMSLKKTTYAELNKKIDAGLIANESSAYKTKYYYHFGQYDKIIDYDLKKIKLEDIEKLNKDKIQIFMLEDSNKLVKMIMIKDFSEQKDMFYGKVNRIYSDKDDKLNIVIKIFEYKELNYLVSGLVNCEEGDVISFKIKNKDTIEVIEKYTTKAFGYYKDIIIEDITYDKKIVSKNGEINLKSGIITSMGKTYDMSKFVIIILDVGLDEQGELMIKKGDAYELKDLKLKPNDRIAINEIEDTIIIYRGYKE